MAIAPENEVVNGIGERTEPPFLRRVRIRGYKSIAFCDVTLQPLTILVGRNASGKSNFLDALAFLRDLLDSGVNSAVLNHGGDGVFSRLTSPSRLSFEVEADFSSDQMPCRALYRVELVPTDHKQVMIDQEALELTDLTHNRQCGFSAVRGRVTWQGLEHFGEGRAQHVSSEQGAGVRELADYPSFFDQYRADRLLLGVIGSQPFLDLAEGLRSIGCYNFQPISMRPPQPSFGSPVLERDGRNLARAIEGLKEIDEELLSRVSTYLRAVVREIEGFEVVQLGDYETIRFHLHAPPGLERFDFNASSMSDGTLRALAALVAAFQIWLPCGPSLVAIDEPETSLHPAALRALVDALDEATGQTQILLTTQSADFLDNPTIRPENLRVVQMIDGQTVIGPVDEASVDIVRRKLNTLGGLERDNLLEPDPDDLERQQRLGRSPQEPPA